MNLYGVLRAPQLVLDDIKLLRDLRVINYIKIPGAGGVMNYKPGCVSLPLNR